jgi:hypothetical protein|tara:strand:+ start:484 stop:753 length:270 start_codon:yes stop_codon:yes gene_type:complete
MTDLRDRPSFLDTVTEVEDYFGKKESASAIPESEKEAVFALMGAAAFLSRGGLEVKYILRMALAGCEHGDKTDEAIQMQAFTPGQGAEA